MEARALEDSIHSGCVVLLNVAVGGSWGGQKGVDQSIWSQRFEIDYVRVFRLKG
jgi:hypothetical protein